MTARIISGGRNTLRYDIYCCDFSISGTYSGLYGYLNGVDTYQEYSFVLSQDSLMTLGVDSYTINGAEVTPEYSQMTMRKIPLDLCCGRYSLRYLAVQIPETERSS